MKRNSTYLFPLGAILVMTIMYFNISNRGLDIGETSLRKIWSAKKAKVKSGNAEAFMKPDGFIEYYNNISKKIGESESGYLKGYRFRELSQSISKKAQARNSAPFTVEFISRGPGNVGGRTRAIAVDPDDNTHCTWIAGAASGGLWKTTDCGQTWTNISPELPNLSTNSIAQSISNPDVIYVGTGEVFAGNSTFVRGDGVYKSIDRGQTWSLLPSTTGNADYNSVNRIAVDPTNEEVIVIATNSGIYKSLNGGESWIETFDALGLGSVQDLQVDPNDFAIQYAGVNSSGIFKSVDAGETWIPSSEGILDGVRFEIAVAPGNSNIVYTSSYVGETTLLYYSENKGASWVQVEDSQYNTDFLGGQGWYDNTIAVNPYNPYEVFVGGVSIGKYLIDPNNVSETTRKFLGVDLEGTPVVAFVDFGAEFNGGTLNVSDGSNNPSQNPVTIEIRFGGENTQKAHRFTVPQGATSGVDIADYTYQDYIDVPFEVWDIENDKQLMVSFRDQERNGEFNLNKSSSADDAFSTAREYFYVHDLEYNPTTPNANVAVNGGVEFANMYYFWPVLAENAQWNPSTFINSVMRIKYGSQTIAAAEAVAVYDAYGDYESQNINTVHPDHHHLTLIKTNDDSETFMIINGNDGGFSISRNNGITMNQLVNGYVTSQFYGADKKPGEDKYVGGTQDNGTWVSSGTFVDATNAYSAEIGGDGFEVIWHATDPQRVIGGYQYNGIQRSTNGGNSFSNAFSGINVIAQFQNDGPFITRLAGSTTSPDIIYAIGQAGVYKSTNFGSNWIMKPISSDKWGGNNSASDVEVSLANDQIVWAGAGMAEGVLNLFVSTDAGETFSEVNNYSPNPQAYYTGIYTHPTDENTAYALFSRADFPKILKTTDLGQTWVDISGFAEGGTESARGFPDVFVHSLLVMPFNTDIIWVGTEIGLYESLDGGESWNIRNDLPAVSIWSMKIVDDQVVIGTHGRGIWTATIEELPKANLLASNFNYSKYGKASIDLSLPINYSKVQLIVNGEILETINSPVSGQREIVFPNNDVPFEGAKIRLKGEFEGVEYLSKILNTGEIGKVPQILSYSSSVGDGSYPVSIELENTEPFDSVEVLFGENKVYTDYQVLTHQDGARLIEFEYPKAERFNLQLKGYIGEYIFTTNSMNVVTANKQQQLNEGLKLYPNPANKQMNLNVAGQHIVELSIYTSNGQYVKSQSLSGSTENAVIDIQSLKQGMYLLQIKDNKGALRTKRFVKQ